MDINAKLEHSEIHRAGASATRWNFETRNCSFKVNVELWSLDFTFQLSAAGGGATDVLLRIRLSDFPLILKGIDHLRTLEVSTLRQRNFQLRQQVEDLETKLASSITGVIGEPRPK
jgi:hypothetical protein